MSPVSPRIVVVGLGYVGLPLAVALAKSFPTTGLDINTSRVDELRAGHDRTNEIDAPILAASSLVLTSSPTDCAGADLYIVTVPTPVDEANLPDLRPVMAATRTVAALIKGQSNKPTIVYESTVYPGVTEDLCGPELESLSGLKRGRDFFLGYSPERINPGDREHTVDRITKVIAGENADVTALLARVYGAVTSGGTFPAASIKAAEAAKVIENAQRDINIAFMNEITQIFARIDLSIWDVLAAARTKWNFLPFQPGLVGGHCIGVDPYYLAFLAQRLGHDPQVILSGRSTNDGMGAWVADQIHTRRKSKAGSVLVLGLTFKEDVPDLRNSRVIDVIRRLEWLGYTVEVHDPLADPAEAAHEYGTTLHRDLPAGPFDVVVGAVAHQQYRAMDCATVSSLIPADGLIADLKGIWPHCGISDDQYWSL